MSNNHKTCEIGESLSADYFSPGTSIINGQLHCSLWAEIPHKSEWLRFERSAFGEPWVRVEQWVEFVGMPWNRNRLYRFRGRHICGWPSEVEYYDDQLKKWEKTPNYNVHKKASYIQTARKEGKP